MPSFFHRKKATVPPGRMTLQELVLWSNGARDAKEFIFRRGFSRHVMCSRENLLPVDAIAQLTAAGARESWEGKKSL
jgi:hypothetical protein